MEKLRVLWCGEASFLSTGFATYSREILKRLHPTGKYDICEYGSYGAWGDPRAYELPWKYATPMPQPGNEQERAQYESSTLNEFGEWKFEEVCLQHLPHACVDYRDWWMFEHQERSPFRPYYHWSIMPAIDGEPQVESWISTYKSSDAVLGYSDWGLDVLRKQGLTNIKEVAPPGADFDTYHIKPNKRAHKQSMGLEPDSLIVMFVARNQKRKLFPDLMEAFSLFLKEAPSELANKTYLYLHTCWPDVGYDLPSLMKEFGLSSKCLFTYLCHSCGAAFPDYFSDARTSCQHCGKLEARFPTTQVGVSEQTMNEIYGLGDVFVQYAKNEGFGMPTVEASACGLVAMAVDYSAMSDVIRKVNGTPIRVERFYRESETGRKLALPDNRDFIEKLIKLLQLPSGVRQKMGYESRKLAQLHYNYDTSAKVWENHFDEIAPSLIQQDRWASPAQIHKPNLQVPPGLSEDSFVRFGVSQIAGRPDLLDSYMVLRMTQDLTWGVRRPQMGGIYFNESSTIGLREKPIPFSREDAVREFLKMADQKNYWERRRLERVKK